MMEERLRLAFVLPHLRMGGVETVICNLLRSLDRETFEPVLVLKQREGELLARLPADCSVETLGEGRAPMLVPALRRFFLRHRPDVVYSATSAINIACLSAVRSLPRRARPITIAGEHTLPTAYIAQAKWPVLRGALTRLLYPTADALVVPADAIGLELRHLLRGRSPPIHVLPNPVLDMAMIGQPPKAGCSSARPDGAIFFAAAGRLVEAKGFDLLIAAFARAAVQLPHSRLTIYGDGPQGQALRLLACDLGVGERVFMPGNVDDLAGRLADHDVFVLSSRREGFGNVVVEAMAAGLPVITTDQAGPRALLDGGKAGLVVPAGGVRPLAKAMVELAGRSDLRRDFAAVGLRRCGDFTIAGATRQFERFVVALCAGQPGRVDCPASRTVAGRPA